MDLSWMLEEYDGIVYVSDMDSHELLYVNKTGRELFRVDEAALSRRPRCYEVLQGRDAPCPFCTGTRLNESDFYEWEFYNPRLQRTLLLNDRKVRWNGRNARIEFATDISGYRRAIAGHERQRDSILQSLPGGIVRVDARDGRTVLWHGAHFLEMIGYTAEEFAQELHNKCLYVHPDDLTKITALMGRLQESGGTEITEMRIVTREGRVRTLTTTLSYGDAASSPDGIPSFYSVGIDITEIKARQELQQKALEDACRAARAADRAKTDFLSRMSHDIRTPLNAILGMADIAGTRLNDPRGAGECLKKIQTSGRHLLNLINEVLDMSKIESGQMRLAAEEMELAELVRNVLDVCGSLVKEKGHTLAVRADVAHERVRGDFGRLQQLFTNLLANAAKYTPAGGSISFSIDELPSLYTDVGLFECVIEDNGIGMSEDFVKHLFEPFKRADDPRICKVQGTGLGLVISRSIVRLMGGGIKVESRPEEGSRFIVSLPLRLAKETAAAAGAACEQAVLVLPRIRSKICAPAVCWRIWACGPCPRTAPLKPESESAPSGRALKTLPPCFWTNVWRMRTRRPRPELSARFAGKNNRCASSLSVRPCPRTATPCATAWMPSSTDRCSAPHCVALSCPATRRGPKARCPRRVRAWMASASCWRKITRSIGKS